MVQDLAREVLTTMDLAPDETGMALSVWLALGQSGVLAASLPESLGGMDGGLLAACSLAIEIGKTAAPLPVLPSLFGGTLVLMGRDACDLLSGLASGEQRVAAAWTPAGRVGAVDGLLHGSWTGVAGFSGAAAVVIPMKEALVLVQPENLQTQAQTACNGETLHGLVAEGAEFESIGDAAQSARARDIAQVGLAAISLGLAKGGLDLTARYVRERHQFGRPIGSFQAVQQRAADMYIQVQAMEVTLWQAAWRVSEGLDARRELAIARNVASLGSHRVLSAAHHLHGGMGFDCDYPLYRYTQWSRQLESLFGGPEIQLERLGELLASE
jgi:alkylation response protein AidB-like acyl-CoA dehydrogenase